MLIVACWRWTGVNILYFLAGLQSIDTELYEAASIDGANKWQQFVKISVPLLKPTTVYVLTISIYAGLSMFLESFMLWKGNNSPQNIGLTIVGYLYRQGIEKRAMGYACAAGLVLLFTGDHDYWIWFGNSLLLTVITVVLTLLVSSFVAYGFAAYDFKGKNFFFVIVLIILSIPFEVIMLPLYSQISKWGMMDSYVSIILPFLAHASTIFFFRQYLLGLPKSLIEAGRIDGCTEYGIFFKLIAPIMKPAFSAMAILNGMNAWNNYMWPLLVIRSSEKYTLTIGLNTLINPYGDNYSLLVVGSVFSIIPIFILFICFQRYFIEGMTAGAVKR